MSKENKTIGLLYNGNQVDLDLKEPSMGAKVVDLKNFSAQTGLYTFDPSYRSTASSESYITYVDGTAGVLSYRGYPIEQLASESTYLEVAFLLYHGELPSTDQLEAFRLRVKQNMVLEESVASLLETFPKNTHPMSMLITSLASLSSICHDRINIKDSEDRETFFFEVLGRMPMLVATILNHSSKKTVGSYDETLNYSANILNLFFGDNSNYVINPVFSRALDILLILHADHEQNCSTSSVRLTGSSGTNPYAAMSAGVAALWGPLHGGANEAVVKMFDEIKSKDRINYFIEKAKDKNDPFRLMGFGHGVYKNYDPRAAIIRASCHEVLDEMDDGNNPTFELAMELEEIALNDEYFIDRNLYPNVDFYSGIIYQALGLPKEMFTAMFALARIVGWATHWCEMMDNPSLRIGRPRQLYLGPKKRNYIPLDQR
ncbi:MAG: citrate (Si)-synthase [Gammaproteobacteria bacterium]|nr:citrate (Si)-synthase [Gammaproteobacteria bacterium]